MQTRRLLCASLVVLLLFLPACSLANTQRRDDSFAVSGPARLEGDVGISRVMIHGTNTDQIHIQATLRHARQTAYRTTQSDNTIRIQVETAAGFASSAGQPAVEIVATVPETTELDLRSSTGDIYVDEIAGRIVLATSGGSLQLSDCQNQIELRNQTGKTECRRVEGTFFIRSHAGSVNLDSVGGAFDVETDSGEIDVLGRFADGQAHCLVSSTGAIEVDIVGTPNLRLDATSETGLVRCVLTMREQSITDHQCSGVLGNGAGTLQVRTSTGRITVK
jgi:DUF4097 and DUF4098 domain-containing protein YvlB